MSTLILEVWEYPSTQLVPEEELQDEGIHSIIQQAKDLIRRLEERL